MTAVVHLTSSHRAQDTRVFRKECVALASAGYEVSLVVPTSHARTLNGVNIVPVPESRTRLRRLTVTCRDVYRVARKLKADIYHIHDPEMVLWALLLKKTAQATVIYDVHEYYAEVIPSREWFPVLLRKPAAVLIRWLESLAAARFDGIIVVNDDMAERFRGINGKVVTVRNFPRLENFDYSPALDRAAPRNGVVFVGAVSDDRGLNIMLEAVQLLGDQGLRTGCTIIGPITAGRFKDIPLADLNRRWSSFGVEFTGPLSYEHAMDRVYRSQVAWWPVQDTTINHSRALPNKLFEYMAAGKPVVASNYGYVAEILRNASAGLLVAPADAAAHAAAVAYLLRNPAEAAAMGARGRQAVVEHYNWAKEEAKLLQFYAGLNRG